MNTPVSFELSKLLKEKGFPQAESVYQASQYGLQFTWYNSDGVYMANYNLSNTIQAPTISDVVVWLYKNHKIWISVDLDDDDTFVSVARSKSEVVAFDNTNTPTEAYLQAIEHALKNLI